MRISLRNRFLIPTLGLIVVSLSISTAVSYFQAQSALSKAVGQQLRQISTSVAQTLDSWVGDRKLDMTTWSQERMYRTAVQDGFMGKSARESANAALTALKESYGYYQGIYLADTKGDLIAANRTKAPETKSAGGKPAAKVNIVDREYFKAAMAGQTYASQAVKSRGTGDPVFIVAAPVKKGDQVNGVLFGVVDLEAFSRRFVTPIKIGETGYVYIIQKDSTIIAHPDKKQVLKTKVTQYPWGRELLKIGNGQLVYTYQGVEKVVSAAPVDILGWTVVAGASTEELHAPARQLGWVNLIIALVAVLVAGLVVFWLAHNIVGALNRIIKGLTDGSDQVADASGQMASSSQELAQGSSEQAAALEESASSLEEMASMTRQNADNASQADGLMKETNQVVVQADGSMAELTKSMEDISAASDETAKIVKTIDEIAFQTNLLALNAAVEAARAGEAGAGFAVVADEVRNLAMRAAEAAKSTAGLIEGTVQKVRGGAKLVSRTAEAFGEVSQSTGKVGELVGEIAAASSEQAQGIDQVNKAVAEMEKLTQRLAASAEESASASEEMNAQASGMKIYVNDLNQLVAGGSGERSERRTAEPAPRRAAKVPSGRMLPPPAKKRTATGKDPAKEIPLGDDDFSDF